MESVQTGELSTEQLEPAASAATGKSLATTVGFIEKPKLFKRVGDEDSD